MHLEQIPLQFQKFSKQNKLNYSLRKPASKEDIFKTEQRLIITFPEQVKLFYESYNGLYVEDPQLEILPIEKLHFVTTNKLRFTIINGRHQLYFDTSEINEAKQWSIISEEEYLVTMTMASFWSNKIWAWIKQRREIWKEEFQRIDCPKNDPF